MRAALDVLRLQPATRRVAILGDMLELGDAGPAEHAALAADVVRSADLVFTCGPLMRHLFEIIPAPIQGRSRRGLGGRSRRSWRNGSRRATRS